MCEAAYDLAHNSVFKKAIYIKLCISICGTIMPLVLLKIHGIPWLAHPNAKIIFSTHLFFAVMGPLAAVFIHASTIYQYSFDYIDPCDYLMPATRSFHTRAPNVVALIGQIFSMFALCFERCYSTIKHRTYDKVNGYKLGVSLSVIAFISAFATTYGLLLPNVNWDKKTALSTTKYPGNSEQFQVFVIIEIVFEILNLLLYAIAFIRNRQVKNKICQVGNGSLSNKYQLSENTKIISIMVPLCVCHSCIMFVKSFGLHFFPLIFNQDDFSTYFVYMEAVGQISLYSVLFPIFLLWKLRKQPVPVDEIEPQQEYFLKLKTLFEGPIPS